MKKSSVTKESFTEIIATLEPNDLFGVFERQVSDRKSVPHNRRDFYKTAVTTGTGTLYYADKIIRIYQPALIFSTPLIPYSWEAISIEQEGFFCLFTEEFLVDKAHHQFLKECPLFSFGVNPVYFLNKVQLAYIRSIFINMLREYNSDYRHKYDLLHSHINLLFHEAMKMDPLVSYTKHNASERILDLFTALIEGQFPVDSLETVLKLRTAHDYAEQLSIHVNHLNRAVKEVTGKTTTEHLNERFINEAKSLLQHTNWTINEIAYSLGYEHPTYFTNFFRKQTGTTPNAVRIKT